MFLIILGIIWKNEK